MKVKGKRLKVKGESRTLKELVIPANAGIQGWGLRANR